MFIYIILSLVCGLYLFSVSWIVLMLWIILGIGNEVM